MIQPGVQSTLNAVSCLRDGWCTAVGYSGDDTLIESFSGTRWTTVHSPYRGVNSGLDGVSCVSKKWCVAVGYSFTDSVVAQPLIESWNGHRWTVASGPRLWSAGRQLRLCYLPVGAVVHGRWRK